WIENAHVANWYEELQVIGGIADEEYIRDGDRQVEEGIRDEDRPQAVQNEIKISHE
ncbi:unnamed protein product, partial [Didymodactylos carnosus]